MKRNRITICGRKTSTAPTPGDHPVDQKALQEPGRQASSRPRRARLSNPAAIRSMIGAAPGEHRLEHHEQQAEQDDRPRDRMQHDRVDHARSRCAGSRGIRTAAAMIRSASRRAARRSAAVGWAIRPRRGGASPSSSIRSSRAQQRVDAGPAHRGRGDHRQAELGRHPVEVDLDAARRGDVDHVEHQQHRQADALQFQSQPQAEAQVGGVGDHQQEVGRGHRRHARRARRRGSPPRPGCGRAANRCPAGR